MTKCYLFLAVFFAALINAYSQDMPKISTDDNEYWYIVKNQDPNKPRSFLAMSFNEADDVAVGKSNWDGTELTKWKIVKDEDANKYGLVCKIDDTEYYLQSNVTLTEDEFTEWTLKEASHNTATGFILEYYVGNTLRSVVHQTNNGFFKLIFDYHNTDVASIWRFIEAKEDQKLSVSDNATTTWYIIRNSGKDKRANKLLAAGESDNPLTTKTELDESCYWKVVASGDNFVLVNKNGVKISWDKVSEEDDHLIGTDDGSELNINPVYIPNLNNTAWRIYGGPINEPENVLHLAGNGEKLMNYTEKDIASCWEFLTTTDLLKNTIDKAKSIKENTPLGSYFGEYSQEAKNTLGEAITKAEAAITSGSGIIEQLDALKQALAEYKEAINFDLDQLCSTEDEPKWFYIINNYNNNGAKQYSYGSAITSKDCELGDNLKWAEIDASDTDPQLWRFEKGEDNNVKIINKANPTWAISRGATSTETPEEFKISLLEDFYSLNITGVGQDEEGNDFSPLHAQQVGKKLVTWPGTTGSASMWIVKSLASTRVGSYIDLIKKLRAIVDSELYVEGDYFGQFEAGAKTAFDAVIKAEEAKDAKTLTTEEIEEGIVALNTAFDTFKSKQHIDDASLLAKDNTLKAYFTIRSYNYPEKVMSSNENSSDKSQTNFSFEPKDENYPDAQLFYFEKNSENLFAIGSKGALDSDNSKFISLQGTRVADANFTFKVLRAPSNKYDIYSFILDPNGRDDNENGGAENNPLHAEKSTQCVVSWTDTSTGSFWYIEFVNEGKLTDVKNLKASKYNVYVENYNIVVEGATNFVVYNINGQQINNDMPLQPGIYIVKVNDYVQKVIVK